MARTGKRPSLLAVVFLLCASGALGQVVRGEGDFEFFLDTTALPGEGGRTLALFQLAIPSKEIHYEEQDGAWRAAVSVFLELKRDHETVHEKGLVIRDSREARPVVTDLSGFIYLSDSSTVAPGTYVLTVRVEDLQRRKKTLFGVLRNRYLYSEIDDLPLEVPAFPVDRVALSDPVLIWSRDAGGQFVPNPMQIYGLKNDTLSFFASARVPPAQAPDSFDLHVSIIDQWGEVVAFRTGRTAVSGNRALVYGAFDVNAFTAGNYTVAVDLYEGGEPRASSSKEFNVAWELLNWQKPRRDVLVEARFLFSDGEFDRFRKMSIGEQERVLAGFWKSIDPTPHTAFNELYEIFRHRVAFADNRYREGGKRGSLTDRGQMYIRLGPPDEIVQESVPFNREDLSEALDMLEDRYKVILHSTTKGHGTEQAMLRDVSRLTSRPFRGSGIDTGGFELWIYNQRGEPIFEQDRIMTIRSGMRFLFIDMDGIGNYRLIGTSEEKEGF